MITFIITSYEIRHNLQFLKPHVVF